MGTESYELLNQTKLITQSALNNLNIIHANKLKVAVLLKALCFLEFVFLMGD